MKAGAIKYELITDKGSQPYAMLAAVRAESHSGTKDATIALAWKNKTKSDADGRLVLGTCIKASELQRELIAIDFIIVLNREIWEHQDFTDKQRAALLDHELMHAAPALDKDGEQKVDGKLRLLWRIRRHDIEEFRDIVFRHGCYKADLEAFAEAIMAAKSKATKAEGTNPPETTAAESL